MPGQGLARFFGRAYGRLEKWKSAHEHGPGKQGGPAPRLTLQLALEIRGYQKQLKGLSRNIALGGMLLEADGPLSVGEPVHVDFELPGDGRISIPAVVCRNQRPAVAIRFDVTDPQREIIGRWVDAHLPHAS